MGCKCYLLGLPISATALKYKPATLQSTFSCHSIKFADTRMTQVSCRHLRNSNWWLIEEQSFPLHHRG